MTSQLSRRVKQPVCNGISVCKASTSRQGFATTSSWRIEDNPQPPATSSMQQTETQITPPQLVGDADTVRTTPDGRRPLRNLSSLPPYPEWIQGEAKQYEDTPRGKGPFWIGDTPFPLNPSFDPSPPIAQSQKRALWRLHQSDPANTIRILSSKYGIAMERLRAILRLQALETEWTRKGKALQEPFQEGMDRILGAVERQQGATLDEQVATEGAISAPRAATFEEFPMRSAGETEPSILAKALKAEAVERGERRRTIPTGGPATKGPRPTVMNVQGPSGRASLTVVDMSARPTSYVGGGVIVRNQRRAEKRKAKVSRNAELRAASQRKEEAQLKLKINEAKAAKRRDAESFRAEGTGSTVTV